MYNEGEIGGNFYRHGGKNMKKGSVILTAIAVILCMIILVGISIFAPFIADWFAEVRDIGENVKNVILTAFYICSLPALCSLICLLRILSNIWRDEPFKNENPRLMSIVSYCCLAVAAATIWAGFYYMPMFLVSAAMLFVLLIVRVVRACFISAMHIAEENSLTI